MRINPPARVASRALAPLAVATVIGSLLVTGAAGNTSRQSGETR
jgi:hypothetical protein